jgi:uncharacterized protein (DUF1015 family)
LLCPPYDVISPDEHKALLGRDPHNAVRLELPMPPPGGVAEDRYREAARTLVKWRTGGVLRKEKRPSLYVYEQRYEVPGTTVRRRQRGFFAKLKLEPFGPDSGVRPHERTLSGPKADRYELLKATGSNLSAVATLYRGGAGVTASLFERLTATSPDAHGTDTEGVQHLLWVVPAVDDAGEPNADVAALLAVASAGPMTIADGHHRYETALRYRAERGVNRACESDPGYDYVLALAFDVDDDEPLTVLPTHRLVHGGLDGAELLGTAEAAGYGVERVEGRQALASAFDVTAPASERSIAGSGRFGVWSGGHAAIVRPPETGSGGGAVSSASELAPRLDVSRLGVALEQLLGIDAGAVAGGGRLGYTHDLGDALDAVERGDATTALLLDPTPVDAVLEVAAQGGVMPQKSTYFYPKAGVGLVFGPLEW